MAKLTLNQLWPKASELGVQIWPVKEPEDKRLVYKIKDEAGSVLDKCNTIQEVAKFLNGMEYQKARKETSS